MSIRLDHSSHHPQVLTTTATAATSSTLRVLAIERDASSTVTLGLPLLLRELSLGLCLVADAFFTNERAFLVTTPNSRPAPLSSEQGRILSAILAGVDQVSLAIDLNVAPSTIAARSRQALDSIGMTRCRPARPNPLLMLAALASRASDAAIVGRVSVSQDANAQRTISIPRTEHVLADVLTAAELTVVRSLFEGNAHDDIARRRGTSRRTVANQIASLFRRLNVSGRNALLLAILERSRPCFL